MVWVRSSDKGGNAQDATTSIPKYIYRIRQGDELSVRLKDDGTTGNVLPITGNVMAAGNAGNAPRIYAVDEKGQIKLPEIGLVSVEGLTLSEINTLVTEKALGYVPDANVHVSLENYFVKVLGQVKLPGVYEVRSLEPNFFEGIGLANGFTDYANRKEVQIVRTVGSDVQVSYVDITSPEFFNSLYYYLYPGDVIVVNPVGAKKFENNTTLTYALSGLSTLAIILNLILSGSR